MSEIVGQRFVFAVARKPFESPSSETGIYNQFCTLLPLFDSVRQASTYRTFPTTGTYGG